MANRQAQEAGDGSQLFQAGGNIINVYQGGITEERALEIMARLQDAIDTFVAEGEETATRRMEEFDQRVVDNLAQSEMLAAIADPAFQILIRKAQIAAAASAEEGDHEVLTNLLHERAVSSIKPVHMVIHRAIEVVDQIDEEALVCVTNFWAATLEPTALDPVKGLTMIDDLVAKLDANKLPDSGAFLERLDLLSCMRVIHGGLGSLKTWKQFTSDRIPGYFSAGVAGPDLENARQRLTEIDPNFAGLLIKDGISLGSHRLSMAGRSSLTAQAKFHNPEISPEKLGALDEIANDLKACVPDSTRMDQVENYIKENLPNLNALREWWNRIDQWVTITPLGIAVAYANAKRFASLDGLPPLRDLII